MKKARSNASVKSAWRATDEAFSLMRDALLLEVDWLRQKGWTDNEIHGLWTRLLSEYKRTSARVRGRQRR